MRLTLTLPGAKDLLGCQAKDMTVVKNVTAEKMAKTARAIKSLV